MVVVIFESWPKTGSGPSYLALGEAMSHLLEGLDGFISIERFESVVQPGKFVALSFWRDEQAVRAFRNLPTHRTVQDKSRRDVFDSFRVRVADVTRDYSNVERAEAPVDSEVRLKLMPFAHLPTRS